MRVIAGTYRSRVLQAPLGTATRPTSDRLRETLFNVLGPQIQGARFADLYAGSGAVGIEALSRGAAEVFFAETGRAALEAIRTNLRALGIAENYTLEPAGTAALLRRPRTAAAPFDLVFLDPPYNEAAEYAQTLAALGASIALDAGIALGGGSVLCAESIVIAEHARKTPLLEAYGCLQRTRTLPQGDAALSFYAVRRAVDPSCKL